MSLDLEKLEKVRQLANGMTQARCPACAEGGNDRTGEHLRIYPDGRFGCCVHPKDKEHRRRIFALVGNRTARRFVVRVAREAETAKPARSIGESLKGFARTLRTGETESVSGAVMARTLRTPKSESVSSGPNTPDSLEPNLRTLRTGNFTPYAYAREEVMHTHDGVHTCKGAARGVLSVLSENKPERLPFLTAGGGLCIPPDSPERFHWWKPGGQSMDETFAQVLERMADEKRKAEYGHGV